MPRGWVVHQRCTPRGQDVHTLRTVEETRPCPGLSVPVVTVLDDRGELLQTFGSLGEMLGQFVRPKGVAVDREDRVYVVDAASEVVQIFNADGELLLFFGGAGNIPGGLNLPAKVVIDYDNVDLFADRVVPGYKIEYLVIVTSQFGPNKVSVFGYLEPNEQGGG